MNEDSRSRHPSRPGPRTPLSQENDALDQLVQADAHHPATLAELYRKARQRGLIHARPQYT